MENNESFVCCLLVTYLTIMLKLNYYINGFSVNDKM
jgi:hypothetical protein